MIGERHELDDYVFYETAHGPMNYAPCVDCFKPVMVVGRTDRVNRWGLKEDTGGGVPARCEPCGRSHHGTPATVKSAYRYSERMGQGGTSMPCILAPAFGAVSLRKTRVVSSLEVLGDDAWDRLPPAARALAERVDGRVLISVARRTDSPTTAAGKVSANWSRTDTFVGVQWRPGGRPPTRMAIWKNGQRAGAMVGEVAMTHTDIGAL